MNAFPSRKPPVRASLGARTMPVACFWVQADADPQTLPRVLQVFAKRGLVPSRWHSTVGGDRRTELHIDIQVTDLDSRVSELLAQSLRQMFCVQSVLTAAKEMAAAG